MRLFSQRSALAGLLAVCSAMMVSPLYAINLNPIEWSLHAQHEKTAPGSTIVLRLHAEIADGYHLYSLTTPAGADRQRA